MSDYLAEIALTEPIDTQGARRLALAACLDLHRVDWLRSYIAADRRRMLCWYRAPDAEAVRRVLRQMGAAATPVIAVTVSGGGAAARSDPECERVVVEFPLDTTAGGAESGAAASNLAAALAGVGSTALQTFVSRRGDRLVGVVDAPDEAEVSAALQRSTLPAGRVWRCLEIDPRPPPLFQSMPAPRAAGALESPAGNVARPAPDLFDVVIIGAGFSGIGMLERVLRMGLRARVFEQGGDVGGVWYWNRYPGARVDSETFTYGFSFSEALLEEWDWQELFAPQPEIEDYLRHVTERFDLRKHMRFHTRVKAAHWEDAGRCWHVETETGERVAARFLIAAAGTLSSAQLPDYPGIDCFSGESHHTARWPRSGVDLADRRVGVVGTGATGVQVIQTIAPAVGQLTVFQRTPTYCIPQRNRRLTADDRERIRRDWSGILQACRESVGGFVHNFEPRSGLAVSAEEREERFEALWNTPGFAFWFGNFGDVLMNSEVNEHACEFVRRKIRARVHDGDTARKLLPTHPFGAKRVPLESGYYEAFNRPNVRLVDLRETPIERITPRGIRTTGEEHALDVIVYATGFDAGTGALTRIDIRGVDGRSLAEKWREGPRTYLGLMASGHPNFFMVNGPQNAAAFCNAGRCIEPNIDWIARCIEHLRARGASRIEPTPAAESEWTAHVEEVAEATVLARMKESWLFGANTPGKARRVMIYAAGARVHREVCEAVADAGYVGLDVS